MDVARKSGLGNADEYLTIIADHLKKQRVVNITKVVLEGRPDEQILNYLVATKIDLVITTRLAPLLPSRLLSSHPF